MIERSNVPTFQRSNVRNVQNVRAFERPNVRTPLWTIPHLYFRLIGDGRRFVAMNAMNRDALSVSKMIHENTTGRSDFIT